MKVFISGYSSTYKTSIGLYELSSDGIESKWEDTIEKPSFLAVKEGYLFAVSEIEGQCILHMYSIEKDEILLVDTMNLPISEVCHIDYLEESKILLGSSYGDGIVFTVSVDSEGFGHVISKLSQSDKQKELSRVHCTLVTMNEAYIYVTNIAMDRIYKYKHVAGELEEVDCLLLPTGSGPRHICFGKNESILYVITEYSNEIYVVDLMEKQMRLVSAVKNVIQDSNKELYGSSLCLSQDGKFLYTATRGANIITVFEVDDYCLSLIQTIDCGGNWPRHIELVEEGLYLAVANQLSSKISLMEVDRESGLLNHFDECYTIESVSCVKQLL